MVDKDLTRVDALTLGACMRCGHMYSFRTKSEQTVEEKTQEIRFRSFALCDDCIEKIPSPTQGDTTSPERERTRMHLRLQAQKKKRVLRTIKKTRPRKENDDDDVETIAVDRELWSAITFYVRGLVVMETLKHAVPLVHDQIVRLAERIDEFEGVE
jgi:hypothetical protein